MTDKAQHVKYKPNQFNIYQSSVTWQTMTNTHIRQRIQKDGFGNHQDQISTWEKKILTANKINFK